MSTEIQKTIDMPPPAQKPVQQSALAMNPFDTSRFAGGSTLKLLKEEIAILSAPLAPEEIQEDKERNLLYAGHSVIRARLNRAIGIGAWCLAPVTAPVCQNNLVLSTWDLYVRGVFVSRVTGEMKYIATNTRMTYGDAIEGSKSNALTRASKDMGIGLELWNKKSVEALKTGHSFAPLPHQQQLTHNPIDDLPPSEMRQAAMEDLTPPDAVPGEMQVAMVPDKVNYKDGYKADGKTQWKRWAIPLDGAWAGTFDHKDGQNLINANASQCEVTIRYKRNKDGKNFDILEVIPM